jgi:hypothetical protein
VLGCTNSKQATKQARRQARRQAACADRAKLRAAAEHLPPPQSQRAVYMSLSRPRGPVVGLMRAFVLSLSGLLRALLWSSSSALDRSSKARPCRLGIHRRMTAPVACGPCSLQFREGATCAHRRPRANCAPCNLTTMPAPVHALYNLCRLADRNQSPISALGFSGPVLLLLLLLLLLLVRSQFCCPRPPPPLPPPIG